MGRLYTTQGQYVEAEPLLERALLVDEMVYGSDHLLVAADLTSLAHLYLDQGQYAEAEPLFKRALVIWEHKRGSEESIHCGVFGQSRYAVPGAGQVCRGGAIAETSAGNEMKRSRELAWEHASSFPCLLFCNNQNTVLPTRQ
ncbi:tetratricopeptide repeat protein [Reticulibacter mediterranei]|uniref:tetratricopeptide repeat protein n=1 Tax=Reticulibacter mediterranei TaxID=2778369 RepID=UPI001C687422